MQMVAPFECSSLSSPITASPFTESRFPVARPPAAPRGLPAERAGYGDALLLTARKLRRIMLHPVRHADLFERFDTGFFRSEDGIPR